MKPLALTATANIKDSPTPIHINIGPYTLLSTSVPWHMGVPQEVFKTCDAWILSQGHYLFSLDYQIRNDNSQHNSYPMLMNQNYTYFWQISKKIYYFLVYCRILVISLCVLWDEKVENHCLTLKACFSQFLLPDTYLGFNNKKTTRHANRKKKNSLKTKQVLTRFRHRCWNYETEF